MPIIFLALVLFLSTAEFSQADDGFTFHGFRNAAANVTLDGAAQIERSGILELTNLTASLVGHAFYETPFRFKNGNSSSSFSTAFAFAIVPEYEKLGGHGFAFAVSKSKGLTGGFPREFLGLFNESNFGNFSNHVFAVEFDTVRDYSFGDIDDNHVGIDTNSLISNASVPASYFAGDSWEKQELNLKNGKLIQAWIDYDSIRKEVNVTLSLSSTKPKSPILSISIDLSLILTEYMYVGFSSSTGLLKSSHYISGWSFQMNGQAQPLDLSLSPSVPARKQNRLPLALGKLFFSAGFCILGIGIAWYIIKKIKNRDVVEPWEIHVGPHRYSYKELKKATRDFSNKVLLGFGGSGRVYKGTMPDSNTHVAVKRIISHESKQGFREFMTEIESIGRLRHRNLVPLQGWCRKRGDLLLVYEFMPNGSLDKYVFDNPKTVLSWEQRLKIIKGVASGLLYLHEEWEQTVIHRDVKAGNVLLDSEMNGRLGDFGLAKMYERGSNPSATKVVGTLGYLAPELTKTGKPTVRSDVFAFGALLLEVVCGRRPVETKAVLEELVLVDWVWEKWREGCVFKVVDTRLGGVFEEVEVEVVIKLGLLCSDNDPCRRPSMRQVVSVLEGELTLPEKMEECGGERIGKYYKVSMWSSASDGVDLETGSVSPVSGGYELR